MREAVSRCGELVDDLQVLVRPATLGEGAHRRQGHIGLPRQLRERALLGGRADAVDGCGDAHGRTYYETSQIAQARLRKLVVLSRGRAPHPGGMSDLIELRREAFRAWVEENGPTVAKVAKRADIPPTTIYSYLSGKSDSLKGTTQDAIATAYDVPVGELFASSRPREVPVVGYVGAGAAAHLYAEEEIDRVPAPKEATRTTVGRRVRGQSIGRHYESWIIFTDEGDRAPPTPDLHGELCVVGLPDERILVKWLMPSREKGIYHLESETEPTMNDQEVLWAAKVTSMRPR